MNKNISNVQFSNTDASRDTILNNQRNKISENFNGRIVLNNKNFTSIAITNKQNNQNLKIRLGELTYNTPSQSYDVSINRNGLNGIVDGYVLENSHRYLVWALGSIKDGFVGLGLSRQPKVAYTAVSSGTKGLVATYTTAGTDTNNVNQFNVGARVRVRNSTEYNYGTVTAINSASSIEILMDSGTYGANITSTTTTEITQWCTYAPKTSGGDFYSELYTLLGWIRFGIDNSATGGTDDRLKIAHTDVWSSNRKYYSGEVIFNGNLATSTTGPASNRDIGRYISPHTHEIEVYTFIGNQSAGAGAVDFQDPITNFTIDSLYKASGLSYYDIKQVTLRLDSNYNMRDFRRWNSSPNVIGYYIALNYFREED